MLHVTGQLSLNRHAQSSGPHVNLFVRRRRRAVGWRHSELVAFGPEIVPLSDADALTAFRHAWDCSSQSRYGLSETAFADIERLDVEDPGPEARRWLAERVGGGKLLVVFGRDEVFQMPAPLFLDRWQDMFCPSRDDVVIFPAAGGWALFYCHEDEFEFARGGPDAEPGAAADGGGR